MTIRRYVHASRAYRSSGVLHQNLSLGSVSRRHIQTLTLKFNVNVSFFIANEDVNRFAN